MSKRRGSAIARPKAGGQNGPKKAAVAAKPITADAAPTDKAQPETGANPSENKTGTQPQADVALGLKEADPVEPAKPAAHPAVILVVGMNDSKLPQGSWFAAKDEMLARKAAHMMKLHVISVMTNEHRALAAELRAGQVYAADRMFAPVIQAGLYDRLIAQTAEAPPLMATPDRPQVAADIQIGSILLATEGEDEGWWEAIVIGELATSLQLRWVSEPRMASFNRMRADLGFLPPLVAAADATA